jgi:RNA polymerase sigma factor (sigma-70 family)
MTWFNKAKKIDYTDDELLQRYLETDDLIFLGELFRNHSQMVYYVCYRYLQDSEKSKDAVMQVFEELIVKVKRQPVRQFASWLYVLTKNYCLMQLRSAKKIHYVHIDEFVEFPIKQHQEEYHEKERELSKLEKCMEKLPEKQKQSIDLFFINERCYKDIIEVTGFSMNEVKSYIQNGKRNLKICMEKNREE